MQIEEQSKTVESQKVRIDRLMDMLANFQKSMYGRYSEKSKYVLGEDSNQISLFNEAEAESNSKALEPSKFLFPNISGKPSAPRKNWQRTFPWWRFSAS